ncbi:MAG: hypothetical protein HC898_09685 [Phycisphaerales bacterium]|nr:hypothetical protein [Phycisphaerales bacterium]
MKTIPSIERLRKDDLLVEVDVCWLEDEHPWSPYLAPEDALRLNDVRMALDAHDLEKIQHYGGRLYRVTPLAVA